LHCVGLLLALGKPLDVGLVVGLPFENPSRWAISRRHIDFVTLWVLLIRIERQ
jgi:hypothetical protein